MELVSTAHVILKSVLSVRILASMCEWSEGCGGDFEECRPASADVPTGSAFSSDVILPPVNAAIDFGCRILFGWCWQGVLKG
ncbi:hypothetical protein Nepgr_030874 [Nepenthes gracilis]|uniref:Secreted protein n=1 Tax=Nepenthes gracilis TaxID=150966 RepID=A0AAD3THE8_NEPGR|nr:hypothetical protein Nepgr_030874 [Nepenthes gracilis]